MEFERKHEQMLERIYNEIVGDEYTEGLIPQVKKNTDKIKLHDLYFKIIIGIFTILSFVFVFISNIKNIFDK